MPENSDQGDDNMRITLPGVRSIVPLAVLSGLPVITLSAGDSTPGEVRTADEARADKADFQYRQAAEAQERRMRAIEGALKSIEERLGRAVHPPTPSRNIERRLQDIEKRLETIERNFKAMDALERKVKQLENQIRRVESRR